eukprot:evm.model.scf_3192.2 EVM.evm.TU.scf_3192.2   scf_3192:8072-8443(-)
MWQKCKKVIDHGSDHFISQQLIYNFQEEILQMLVYWPSSLPILITPLSREVGDHRDFVQTVCLALHCSVCLALCLCNWGVQEPTTVCAALADRDFRQHCTCQVFKANCQDRMCATMTGFEHLA